MIFCHIIIQTLCLHIKHVTISFDSQRRAWLMFNHERLKFYSHCGKMKMKGKKLSKCQFHFPGLLEAVLKLIFFFFLLAWTSEIIQFIRFENHMDRPRYLKKKLGYPIKYLSIWYFISHGWFTARSVLKFGFVT